MYLARREFGKLPWVYPIRAVMTPKVFTFTPRLGEGCEPPNKASTLSLPGICAVAETRFAALAMIQDNEEAALEALL